MDDSQIEQAISTLRKEVSNLPGSGIQGSSQRLQTNENVSSTQAQNGSNLFTEFFHSHKEKIIEISVIFIAIIVFLFMTKPSWVWVPSEVQQGVTEFVWSRFLTVTLVLLVVLVAAYYYLKEKIKGFF